MGNAALLIMTLKDARIQLRSAEKAQTPKQAMVDNDLRRLAQESTMNKYLLHNTTKREMVAHVDSFLKLMNGRNGGITSKAKRLPKQCWPILALIVDYADEDGPDMMDEWNRNLQGRIADLTQ